MVEAGQKREANTQGHNDLTHTHMAKRTLEQTLEELRRIPVVREGLNLLQSQLPNTLRYHSFAHTEDVLTEAIRLALCDELSERQCHLLAIAAVMHDTGFIKQTGRNEPLGAANAREAMVRHGGYTEEEIALVERMILDTALVVTDGKLRQVPSTELSRYLLDADLGNFGRDDFFEKSILQFLESDMEWEDFQLRTLELIESHEWLTSAAKQLWQLHKEENLRELRRRMDVES